MLADIPYTREESHMKMDLWKTILYNSVVLRFVNLPGCTWLLSRRADAILSVRSERTARPDAICTGETEKTGDPGSTTGPRPSGMVTSIRWGHLKMG